MKKLLPCSHPLLVAPALLAGRPRAAASIPPTCVKPLSRSVDQLFGRSQRQALQRAEAGQHEHRQEPQPEVGDASITTGCGPTGTRARRPERRAAAAAAAAVAAVAAAPAPIVVGGLGNGDANNCGPARLGGGILFVDGVIYASSPDNVYAIDARDGTVLWHYYWKTRGGTSLQTRGLGMWHNYIYFELHDDWVVCLDAKTGKEVWKNEIAPLRPAVLLVERADGHRRSRARRHRQRHGRAGVPQVARSAHRRRCSGSSTRRRRIPAIRASRPGPSLDAARHGNGATWIPGSYDPETHLYIYGTGNPTPAYTHGPRRRRQPVHLVAARGQRRYRQDGVVLPDLAARHARLGFHADADPRRHAVQRPHAQARHDRRRATATSSSSTATTGEHLVTSKFGLVNNWASGLDAKGQPKRNPNKDATIAGSLVNGDVTNYRRTNRRQS